MSLFCAVADESAVPVLTSLQIQTGFNSAGEPPA